MEFKAYLDTQWGRALLQGFYERIQAMERTVAKAEKDRDETLARYERSVDDRTALRVQLRERDLLLKELYNLAAMNEFDVGDEFRFHEILTGLGIEVDDD